jgi:hypothetical protein
VQVEYFKSLKHKRIFFRAWKNQTTFLEWHSHSTQKKELWAVKHHMRTLLSAWARVTDRELNRDAHCMRGVLRAQARTAFTCWKRQCLMIWKNRARLLRMFFTNCRARMTSSNKHQNNMVRLESVETTVFE